MYQRKQLTKKSFKTFVWVMVVVVLLLLSRIFVPVTAVKKYEAPKGSIAATEWMKGLEDDLRLNQISIPGSHDSAATFIQPALFAQCQNLTISQQLEKGIRFFDLRLAVNDARENGLYLVHNIMKCKESSGFFQDNLQYDQVLEDFYSFLEKHPSETILILVKEEKSSEAEEFARRIAGYTESKSEYWYTKESIPTLSEARGKIVLCHRYEDLGLQDGIQLSWSDMSGAHEVQAKSYQEVDLDAGILWVQDYYEYSTNEKMLMMEQAMKDASSISADGIFLNFLSSKGTTLAFGTPYSVAQSVNEQFLKIEEDVKLFYGWTLFDYCNEELARKVFESNF